MKKNEHNNITTVIFDWAGTTVDYGCFAPVQAFVEVFRHVGIEPTMEEVRKPMGMLKRDHIKTMLQMPRIHQLWRDKYDREPAENDIEEMHRLFECKLMKVLDQYAEPKPGVIDTVAKLKEKGIKIGSTTGYTEAMMLTVIKGSKEQGYCPDVCVTPDAVDNLGRPYPFMIFRNMELLKSADVKQVIKVGDTVSDILEGKRAGVWSVGVVEGSSEMGLTQEEFEALSEMEKQQISERVAGTFMEAGADYVLQDITELVNLIENL